MSVSPHSGPDFSMELSTEKPGAVLEHLACYSSEPLIQDLGRIWKMKILIADKFGEDLPGKLAKYGEVVSEDLSHLQDADVVLVRSRTKANREFIDSAVTGKQVKIKVQAITYKWPVYHGNTLGTGHVPVAIT